MVIGAIALGGVFLLMGFVFLIFKEKSTIMISGFNALDYQKRLNYDRLQISRDYAKLCFLYGFIFLVTGVLTMIHYFFFILGMVVWIVVFFKDVHLDVDKEFDKYKK